MDKHCQIILEEYREALPELQKIHDAALEAVKRLLSDNNMYITALESRVKTEKSLTGKLEFKGHKYATLADITDLVGIRLVSFYTSEVDRLSALVEQAFEIDWPNSVDKRRTLEADRFGYMSVHYVCRLADPDLKDFRFEIQIRTALQHVWATAYHDTGYKTNIEIPREYIRSLNRLAGLLELADQEFDNIIGDITEYRRRVQALISDGNFDDLEINGDTFGNYLAIKPFASLLERIASINKAQIQSADFSRFLQVFPMLGFSTLGDLEKLKKDYADDAFRLALQQLAGTDLDILSENIALNNLCIVYLIKNGGTVESLKQYFDCLFGGLNYNAKRAKRLFEKAQSIHLI